MPPTTRTLHADAVSTLRGWTAPDSVQEALRARFIAHLETTADGMWRSSYPDHITAGALVISSAGDRVLLNLHKKARRWFAFGGHANRAIAPSPTSLGARRARSPGSPTCGWCRGRPSSTCTPSPSAIRAARCRTWTSDMSLLHRRSLDKITSEESLDVRWWPIDALPELEPGMVDLVAIARSLV